MGVEMRIFPDKARLQAFVRAFQSDRRGATAVVFTLSFAMLAPVGIGIFDVYVATQQHAKLQDALDAATLYAARTTALDNASIDAAGDKALAANLQLIQGASLNGSSFSLAGNTVVGQATVTLPAFAPTVFTHAPITVNSEVQRAGNNVEVALVLDNSTSMAGASLTALKSSANTLVDLVVSDAQTPYYSKVSIIPYGNGVNVGAYAAHARGATQSGTNGTSGTNGSPPYDNFKFKNPSGTKITLAVSTCVSERTGPEAYSDASPATATVGLNYPATANGNPCISAQMAPLSSDKTTIKTSISNLTSCCSTAGHVGIAWGWYTLSPKWNGLFTGNSAPAAYGAPHTIKSLVLMTDGEYNSVYCKGVIAQMAANSSSTGSGSDNDHINCDGTNGKDAYAQAQSLCDAMKAPPNNIIIYTVGLNVLAKPQAQNLVNNCATDAKHVYLPADGTAMTIAFQSIAADINRLRISH